MASAKGHSYHEAERILTLGDVRTSRLRTPYCVTVSAWWSGVCGKVSGHLPMSSLVVMKFSIMLPHESEQIDREFARSLSAPSKVLFLLVP